MKEIKELLEKALERLERRKRATEKGKKEFVEVWNNLKELIEERVAYDERYIRYVNFEKFVESLKAFLEALSTKLKTFEEEVRTLEEVRKVLEETKLKIFEEEIKNSQRG